MNAPDPVIVRPATGADLPALLGLLASAGLPTGDLETGLPGDFLIGEAARQIVGIIGLERLGNDGLLRSLAVVDAWRGRGLGERLVAECEARARRAALGRLYLLTTTAADYFLRRGYVEVPRAAVPAAVAGHAQFRSLCPASARCLRKTLDARP